MWFFEDNVCKCVVMLFVMIVDFFFFFGFSFWESVLKEVNEQKGLYFRGLVFSSLNVIGFNIWGFSKGCVVYLILSIWFCLLLEYCCILGIFLVEKVFVQFMQVVFCLYFLLWCVDVSMR